MVVSLQLGAFPSSTGYPDRKKRGLTDRINSSPADILFPARGSPQQEEWFVMHKGSLNNLRVCQGFGGTLDTIVGTVKRAPEIWKKCGAGGSID